jgi:hypothetical protein
MALPIQYDLFEDYNELTEIKDSVASNKDSIRRTQKKFFAQNKELMKIIVKQQKEIDDLNNRISKLLKVRP